MSGTLYIVAAPSGAGKSSLVNALLEREPGIALSISHTTRPPRPNDRDGEHYHFVSRGEFEQMVTDGVFLEHAEVFGNLYGTSRTAVEPLLAQGRDVLLEIDWQGARQVRAARPDCVSIFILPPSRAELEHRLRKRATDSEVTIQRRLGEAHGELTHAMEFDYLIVNDDFVTALAQLREIVVARRAGRALPAQDHAGLLARLLSVP